MSKIILLSLSSLYFLILTNCSMMEQEERPIRPTSSHSDIAHGHSSPSGTGSGLGILNQEGR